MTDAYRTGTLPVCGQQQQLPGREMLVLGLALTAIGWISLIATSVNAGGPPAIWAVDAIILALLLRDPGSGVPRLLAVGLCSGFATGLVAGAGIKTSLGFAVINSIEFYAAFRLIHRYASRPFDIACPRDVWVLVIGALLAPAICALLIATIGARTPESFPEIWAEWALPHALGILIATPAVLIAIPAWRNRAVPDRRRALEWLIIHGGFCCLAIFVFYQSTYPLLFLLTAMIIISAFRLGALGVLAASAATLVIGWAGTVHGSGPLRFVHGSPFSQLIVGQAIVAVDFVFGVVIVGTLAGRAQINALMHSHHDLFQVMLENIGEVIFRTDASGRWEFLNPAWETLTGYSPDESVGQPMGKLLDPRDAEMTPGLGADLAGNDTAGAFVVQRLVAKDGTLRYVEVSIQTMHTADGSPIGAVGNIRDVTKQQVTLVELSEHRRLFRMLATRSPAGLFCTDLDGNCTYINSAWTRLSGLEAEAAAGLGWQSAIHPEDRERVLSERSDALHRGIEFRGQYRFMRSDGTSIWVECMSGPDIDEKGLIAGYIGVVIDISELKALEFALESALDRSMEAVRAKSSFLANMSHEIRTPMSRVIGFTDLLLLTELTDKQKRHAQLIADSGRAMMRLLNDILDLSKIEAGQMTINREPVNLRDVIRTCIEVVNPTAIRKGLALNCKIAADLPTHVLTDGLRVQQIALNLLGNALKFTERGSVTLHAHRDPDRSDAILIIIEDTGVGIAQERQAAIFEEFVQADTTTARNFGGTGLGLAISNRLARLMEGDISLESAPGLGSRFIVRFVAEAVTVSDPPDETPGDDSFTMARTASAENILLVDDHDINQELMTDMLSSLGRRVEIACNGRVAYERIIAATAAGNPFDLVFMDMQMPVMGGIEATRAIRAAGLGPDAVTIIALSANAFADDVAACLQAGMQAHLSKPVNIDTLTATLQRWCRSDKVGEATNQPKQRQEGPTLRDRYLVRKADMFVALDGLLGRGVFADDELAEFSSLVHKMAGTAGHFGDTELGELAGSMERGISSWTKSERQARIGEVAAAMRCAA